MVSESDSSSEPNLVIITKRKRIKLFWTLYWRILNLILTPLIFLPVILVLKSKDFKSLYVFIISAVYWATDVIHPSIISLISTTLWAIIETANDVNYFQIPIRSESLNALSVIIINLAIVKSGIHRRIALKLLLVFGCSQYRISFILFFTSMFLSMWISDILACGLMIPLVKAILTELEKMGIIEMYQTIGKVKQRSELHEQKDLIPTDFTIFYYLGIAYSSSIGGMATIIGSRSNQIFKLYCKSLFPLSPAIEFPHVILLNLPGVLLMETLVYMWMNAYFLGMFRAHSDIAIEIGMTQEEAMYINTLLQTQYHQVGRMKFYEIIVAVTVSFACILQVIFSSLNIESYSDYNSYLSISSPSLICVVILFITPTNFDFVRFFKRQGQNNIPLPNAKSKSFLNWNDVQNEINWSVPIVIVSTTATMEALKNSGMITKMVRSLEALSGWPAPAIVLVLILLCKILTEFANNPCVVYCVLPAVAQMSVATSVNPHYMMMAATVSSSLPFHLITGSPVNAMVATYVHIPSWKMILAGIGPSVIAIVVTWSTVVLWSRTIWTDIQVQPHWATNSVVFYTN